METNVLLNPEQIPSSFTRCFQSDCPKAETCIRYLAWQNTEKTLTSGYAVYPTARTGDTCQLYKLARVVRMAWGFKKLFSEVKAKDVAAIRRDLYAYFGYAAKYYRYNKGGAYKLTPEQQQAIARIFKAHGYSSEVVFAHYSYEYDFR